MFQSLLVHGPNCSLTTSQTCSQGTSGASNGVETRVMPRLGASLHRMTSSTMGASPTSITALEDDTLRLVLSLMVHRQYVD